jgi:hypothetical protein
MTGRMMNPWWTMVETSVLGWVQDDGCGQAKDLDGQESSSSEGGLHSDRTTTRDLDATPRHRTVSATRGLRMAATELSRHVGSSEV